MKDHLLIADDDPDVTSALRYLLQTAGYAVTSAGSPAEVMALVKENSYGAILIDLNYSKDTTSGQEGLELIPRLVNLESDPAVIVMTAWGSIETAVSAMQAGARDFVQKPWENERLLSIIATQLRLAKSERRASQLKAENKLLRHELEGSKQEVLWASPAMRDFMSGLENVAASDANLLLTGENGTGKSYLVNHVHRLSSRRNKALIKVNMGAIPENLFESELFGHVKGAFTDARENRLGRLELAQDGTLFLDEIGNTPYSQQAKLLRVLEDRRFEKVGSSITQQSNCRLICASNSDLEVEIEEGRFRQDLFYRINTVTLQVPPLRERRQDIVLLADFFLQENRQKYHKPGLKFSQAAKNLLESYDWPGNVRELSHTVERASILSATIIQAQELGLVAGTDKGSREDVLAWQDAPLEMVEKQVIANRIRQLDGDNHMAAKTLGLSKSAFYRKLKKHGL